MDAVSNVMAGKRGLVMGVANERSIAWGIAKTAAEHGAELAFTYQGDALLKRLEPLAQSVGSDTIMQCDVTEDSSIEEAFALIRKKWGKLDSLVRALSRENPVTAPSLATIRNQRRLCSANVEYNEDKLADRCLLPTPQPTSKAKKKSVTLSSSAPVFTPTIPSCPSTSVKDRDAKRYRDRDIHEAFFRPGYKPPVQKIRRNRPNKNAKHV